MKRILTFLLVVFTALPAYAAKQPSSSQPSRTQLRGDRAGQERPFGNFPVGEVKEEPVTGDSVPGVPLQKYQDALHYYRKRIGCTAATFAVYRNRQLVAIGGSGWVDKARSIPCQPDVMINMASCGKPTLMAAFRHFILSGGRTASGRVVNWKTPVYQALEIRKPVAEPADPRVYQITLQHVFEEKAGWAFDPRKNAEKKRNQLGLDKSKLIEVALTLPLQSAPGAKFKHHNWNFYLLQALLSKMTGDHYSKYRDAVIFKPRGIDITMKDAKHPRAVWNVQSEGIEMASSIGMCQFSINYHMKGVPHAAKRDKSFGVYYGSLPNATTIMVSRPDGVDFAVMFNGRRSQITHQRIQKTFGTLINTGVLDLEAKK